ncbi:(2Fe-2S)-binding protein [Hespellia stercorisuis]|uniref:Purine hydroxylase delta subunit apoprotein n=1 Tax=Hespellia stercorisuis DSM 15480 TaxID=1121950 RepID=A0A1M6VDS5_9FIRM|nr:(2Fe-2S)-binding protein [Hespellia stercorisuis]SHK79697.1 purine hydroxylase delta subunit apoprotein [Hespellia stercorisuis DSM 15480]
MKKIMIRFTLNGEKYEREVFPNMRVLDFLRNEMGMRSVKEGCSEGECGACTVIYNGRAVTSCTMLAGQIDGGEIITLEGLSNKGELDVLQQSFMEEGAVQCGYCTPGMILSAKALLMHNPTPTHDEVRRAISGNLCRCTGYVKIVKAIEMASQKIAQE